MSPASSPPARADRRLSVPYHGSRDLQLQRGQCSRNPVGLSVPYHGSRDLQHQHARGHKAGELGFQYPTTGRGICNRTPALFSTGNWPNFQYPTTGRGICNPAPEPAAAAPQKTSFSTLPRVEGSATACSEWRRRRSTQLSVPYHGSRDLQPTESPPWKRRGVAFQYPTTGRGICNLLHDIQKAMPIDFQYPTTGRGICNPRLPRDGLPVQRFLSVPYHGSRDLQRRDG